jgi:hypothetical protein
MGSSSNSTRNNLANLGDELFLALDHFPSIIERTTVPNHSRIHKFAIWAEDTKHIWDGWWDQTPWRCENPTTLIKWDFSKKRSPKWVNYRPISRISDGRPFIQCIRCDHALQHPIIEQSGTTILGRHIESQQCKKHAKMNGLPPISEFFKKKSV